LSRNVSCATEEINLVTNAAILGISRGITGITETVEIVGNQATVEKTAGVSRRVIIVS
jgi:hypothetical protein